MASKSQSMDTEGDECFNGVSDMINDAIKFATPEEKNSLIDTLEGMLKKSILYPKTPHTHCSKN